MSEIVTDLHAMNKMIVQQLEEIEPDRANVLKRAIAHLVKASDIKYFMLLSNERKDYTVFNILSNTRGDAALKFAEEVYECLESRGTIKEFDIKTDANAIEIWIDDAFYALFPYDLGVVEIL